MLCITFYPSFFADVLIAVLSAILGIGGAYLIYLISIRQIRADRLKYVASLIESVIASAQRQAQYCQAHSEEILAKPFANLELRLDANRDTKRLADKMDQEGVYHGYLWKYGRSEASYKQFKDLYGYIDYVDHLFDDLIRTNERVIEFMWQRKKEYQVTFKKLRESIQALSLDEGVKGERPDFVEFAVKTMKEFLDKEAEEENLAESFLVVVDPLRQYIVNNEKPYPKVTEIYLLLEDLAGQYYGIELQAKHNAGDYKKYAEDIAQSANDLKASSEKLMSDFL